jgi:hypothetical protein
LQQHAEVVEALGRIGLVWAECFFPDGQGFLETVSGPSVIGDESQVPAEICSQGSAEFVLLLQGGFSDISQMVLPGQERGGETGVVQPFGFLVDGFPQGSLVGFQNFIIDDASNKMM